MSVNWLPSPASYIFVWSRGRSPGERRALRRERGRQARERGQRGLSREAAAVIRRMDLPAQIVAVEQWRVAQRAERGEDAEAIEQLRWEYAEFDGEVVVRRRRQPWTVAEQPLRERFMAQRAAVEARG